MIAKLMWTLAYPICAHPRPKDLYKHISNMCDFTIDDYICGKKPIMYYTDGSRSVIGRCENHCNKIQGLMFTLISSGERAYEEALVWEVMQS